MSIRPILAAVPFTLLSLAFIACGGGDSDEGASGAAGSGTAGSSAGSAGSGTAGSGTAGSGTAGSGTAGSGTAGTGTAGMAGSAAGGAGAAGGTTGGAAGSGVSGAAGSGTGTGMFACTKATGSCLFGANGYCYEQDGTALNQGTCMGVWSTDPCAKRSDFMAVGGCKATAASGECQTIWVQAKDSPDLQKQLCGPKGGTWVMP